MKFKSRLAKSMLAALCSVAMLTASLAAPSSPPLPDPSHLTQAETLITDLLSDPANTNVYDSNGSLTDQIDWTGSPRTAITVCSSFVTMLLRHVYGFSEDQMKAKTTSKNPNAAKYHDAIVAGHGFDHLGDVTLVLPGDLIAIKYPESQNSSGHIMLVEAMPVLHAIGDCTQDFYLGHQQDYPEIAYYYDVTIIDSSASYHGTADSRYSHPGGIGRNAVCRLFVNSSYQVVGYTWSTFHDSVYKKTADGYLVGLGRLRPETW